MFPTLSTKAIVDNLSNEDRDTTFSSNKAEADDCYSDQVIANRKYIVIVRLCDLYVTGILKPSMSEIKKQKKLCSTYKYCLAHICQNELPTDPNMVRLQLRASETAKSRLVRFKVILNTLHGPMADYLYVDLGHATVYSDTAELIVNKTMEQICNRTNVDVGNYIRNMLG